MAKLTAKCTRCHSEFYVSDMVGTASPKKGMRIAYQCKRCAEHNESYHTSNNVKQGTAKVNNVNCGIEFETSFTDEYSRQIMFEYGFIPTHDCSLSSDGNGNRYGYDGNTCEYVSGIMQGLNKASKFCLTADKLVSDGHMTVNYSCGTHFHVSIDSMKDQNGNKTYMGYIRRFYNSLFVPLCNAMKDNEQATEQLFGRYFTTYAKAVDMNTTQTSHNDRYYFINCLADNNIEFRLNKFVNGKQYQKLIKMEVEMVKCIITNFCEHFNDTNIDNRRYENITAYRKHKASVTAQKLVKLYMKAISE
jgi:hypothetical protein